MDRALVALAALAYLWVAFGIKASQRKRRMRRQAWLDEVGKRFKNRRTRKKGFIYTRAKKK